MARPGPFSVFSFISFWEIAYMQLCTKFAIYCFSLFGDTPADTYTSCWHQTTEVATRWRPFKTGSMYVAWPGLLHMDHVINDKKVILAIITSPKRQCDAE